MKIRKSVLILAVMMLISVVMPLAASAAARDPRSVQPTVNTVEATSKGSGKVELSVTTNLDENPYPVFQWYMLQEDGAWVAYPGAIGSKIILKDFAPGHYAFQVHVRSLFSRGYTASPIVEVDVE